MIEVHQVKGGRRPGWRFRMLGADGEPIYSSNGSYPDAAEAKRVACKFNDQLYRGFHRVRVVK